MQIRQLNDADAMAWRAFRLEGLQAHPEAFGATYEDEVQRPLERWADALRQTDFRIFAAFEGPATGPAVLAASIGLGTGGNAKTAHKAFIYAVYTRPPFRGRGLSARLLDHALEVARAERQTSFRLSVSEPNVAARRIYERRGFLAYGTEPRAMLVNGQPIALVMMALDERTQASGE